MHNAIFERQQGRLHQIHSLMELFHNHQADTAARRRDFRRCG